MSGNGLDGFGIEYWLGTTGYAMRGKGAGTRQDDEANKNDKIQDTRMNARLN